MAHLFNNIIQLFTGEPVLEPLNPKPTPAPKAYYTERDLLRMESAIGRELFGPVPKGHQREFFCLDKRTWIWYERWTDTKTSQAKEQTIRYEVHSNGIVKIQEGQPYKVLEGKELENLETAARIYHERVMQEIYERAPQALHQPIQAAA